MPISSTFHDGIDRYSMVLHGLNNQLSDLTITLSFLLKHSDKSSFCLKHFSQSLCLMLRTKTFEIVVVVVVMMLVVVLVVMVPRAVVQVFQQMLFSFILTISQGAKHSVPSVRLHEMLQITYLHLSENNDDQIIVYSLWVPS